MDNVAWEIKYNVNIINKQIQYDINSMQYK